MKPQVFTVTGLNEFGILCVNKVGTIDEARRIVRMQPYTDAKIFNQSNIEIQ